MSPADNRLVKAQARIRTLEKQVKELRKRVKAISHEASSCLPENSPDELIALGSRLREMKPVMDMPCVYFLMSEGSIVYVGQSYDLRNRLAAHSTDKRFERIFYTTIPLEASLDAIEAAFIRILRPKLNRSMGIKIDDARRVIEGFLGHSWEIRGMETCAAPTEEVTDGKE